MMKKGIRSKVAVLLALSLACMQVPIAYAEPVPAETKQYQQEGADKVLAAEAEEAFSADENEGGVEAEVVTETTTGTDAESETEITAENENSDEKTADETAAGEVDASDGESSDIVRTEEVSTDSAKEENEYSRDEIIVTYESDYLNKGLRLMAEIEVLTENTEGDIVVVQGLPGNSSVEEAIEAVLQSPGVVDAQPNYTYSLLENEVSPLTESDAVSTLATTNDPLLNDYWWLPAVNAPTAWDVAKNGKNVTVAVIDSGVTINHEDLEANLDMEHAWDALHAVSLEESVRKGLIHYSGDSAATVNSHGTHVAGIIGAVANNTKGGAGITYNKARILPVRAFEAGSPSDTISIVRAYNYLINLRTSGEVSDLRVINMSFGGHANIEADTLFRRMIKQAQEAGILSVAAAGNSGTVETSPTTIPSDWDEVLSVTAVDSSNKHCSFSEHNEYKDLCAPGQDITSTVFPNKYGSGTGTSMAAPVVSGTAALLWSMNPKLSVHEVKSILIGTATDLGKKGLDDYYGHGLINAKKALDWVSPVQGYFNIKSGLGKSLTMDVALASTANEAAITTFSDNKTVAQIFQLTYDDKDGCYTIKNPRSGKVLDVPNASARIGAKIWQYTPNGTNAQKWKLEKQSDGSYLIISKLNESLCLDIPNASTSPGTQLQLYTKNYTNAQKFKLGVDLQKVVGSGTYTISLTGTDQVLDVAEGSKTNGANIQLYVSNKTATQKFSIAFDAKTGMYKITNVGADKVLDVAGAGKEWGTNVQSYVSNNTQAQRWYIEKMDAAQYRIYSACNGLVLDAAEGKTTNGTNIQTYVANGTKAQLWNIKAE